MAIVSSTEPRSRRAILAGALGGLGALVARSIGAPDRTDAASAVLLGAGNTETTATTVRNTSATAGSLGLVGRSAPASGVGLQGIAEGSDGKGVYGFAGTGTGAMGVYGAASQGHGVQGYGVIGVVGNGTTWGVYGNSGAISGIGVNAIASNGTGVNASGSTTGVTAVATGSGGIGVKATGTYQGVHVTGSPNNAFYNEAGAAYGVYGQGTNVAGQFNGGAYGVFGQGTSYGVYAFALDSGWGLWCGGDMRVTGTVNPSAAVVKIDHPQAPERKWLSHALIGSSQPLNLYRGTVMLDASGQATVQLPGYFAALNEDASVPTDANRRSGPGTPPRPEGPGEAIQDRGWSTGAGSLVAGLWRETRRLRAGAPVAGRDAQGQVRARHPHVRAQGLDRKADGHAPTGCRAAQASTSLTSPRATSRRG